MIVIIDYGMGNLGSVANMLKKIGVRAIISSDLDQINAADKLILPGVGAFDTGMRNLEERGIIATLYTKVLEEKTPILGLCLGMQLLGDGSEEGVLPGLSWLNLHSVRFRFDPAQAGLKVPHMGWNTLTICNPHPLFASLENEARFYFVHSYYVVCNETQDELARTDYGFTFASAVGRDNILGVQFHPEKSHKYGLMLLKNFVERC